MIKLKAQEFLGRLPAKSQALELSRATDCERIRFEIPPLHHCPARVPPNRLVLLENYKAKRCPNCGAKNRAYKSSAVRYWLLAVLLGVLGFIVYVRFQYESETAECDTPDQRKSFASVIDSSSYAQVNKFRVVDITNIKTMKTGNSITDLACEATITFNSREKGKFRFEWIRSESGALLIHTKEVR